MSFTGTQVATALQDYLDDATDAKYSSGRKLAAINAAISAAWPHIRDVRRDSSVTLSSSTFVYSPTAGVTTTDNYASIEFGFGQAYVDPLTTADTTKVRLRRGIRQVLNGATWTVVVEPEVAQVYTGKTLYLDYDCRVARISALTSSIELPIDYLWKYATWWLLSSKALLAPEFDAKIYKEMLAELRNAYETSLLANRRGLPETLPIGYDHGGANITPEPLSQVNSVRLNMWE